MITQKKQINKNNKFYRTIYLNETLVIQVAQKTSKRVQVSGTSL